MKKISPRPSEPRHESPAKPRRAPQGLDQHGRQAPLQPSVHNSTVPGTTRGERLRIARERHFKSARAAAKELGVPPATYGAHERAQAPDGRGRDYSPEEAAIYAARFKVRPEWLLTGAGEPESQAVKSRDPGGKQFFRQDISGLDQDISKLDDDERLLYLLVKVDGAIEKCVGQLANLQGFVRGLVVSISLVKRSGAQGFGRELVSSLVQRELKARASGRAKSISHEYLPSILANLQILIGNDSGSLNKPITDDGITLSQLITAIMQMNADEEAAEASKRPAFSQLTPPKRQAAR
jgi:hypothetical protein